MGKVASRAVLESRNSVLQRIPGLPNLSVDTKANLSLKNLHSYGPAQLSNIIRRIPVCAVLVPRWSKPSTDVEHKPTVFANDRLRRILVRKRYDAKCKPLRMPRGLLGLPRRHAN